MAVSYGFYACWFLAEPDDAAAIRSIVTTKERRLTEWPHLVIKQVDAQDINKLERLARAKKKGAVGGKMLVRGKITDNPFVAVSEVAASFLQGLAALDDAAVDDVAEKWADDLSDIEPAVVVELLRELAAFARRGQQARKPVFQLDIM